MSQATANVTSLRAARSPASRPASGPAECLRSKTTRYGTGCSSCSGSANETMTSEKAEARLSTTWRSRNVSPTSSQAFGRPIRRLLPPASTSNEACIKLIIAAVKAIDFHVHLPTPEWLDVSMKGYVEAAETYFRSNVATRAPDPRARDCAQLPTR